jgi:hypothetical protein
MVFRCLLKRNIERATTVNANTAMIMTKTFKGKVIESFETEFEVGVGVKRGVEEGEGGKGVFGGKVTVCVLLHPLVSPKNTYGYG